MQNNIEYIEVDLLKETPAYEELQKLAGLANMEMRDLVNRRSQAFRKVRPDIDKMNADQVVDLINDNPRILIRHLLTDGITMVLGFNEENYRQFLIGNN